MMLRRLSERLKQHAWFAVAIDLIVVAAGILILLQLDGWSERRDERHLERFDLRLADA